MPKFSDKSWDRLLGCHEDLQILFSSIIQDYDCTILCGYRSQNEQDIAYAEGKTKLKWPKSKHNFNPSMAIDVAPYPLDWNDTRQFYFFAGHVIERARKLKQDSLMRRSIRWGGDWNVDGKVKDNEFNDLVHFELIE